MMYTTAKLPPRPSTSRVASLPRLQTFDQEDSLERLEMRYLQTERDLNELEEEYRKRRTVRAPSPPPQVAEVRLSTELQEAVFNLFQLVPVEPPQLGEIATVDQLPAILRRLRVSLESYTGRYRGALEAIVDREAKAQHKEQDLQQLQQALTQRESEIASTAKLWSEKDAQIQAQKESLQEQQSKAAEESAKLKRAIKALEAAQHDHDEKEQLISQRFDWISREEQRLRLEAKELSEQRQQLEALRGDIMQDQRRVMEDKDKVAKQLAEIDLKARQLKQGVEAFIKERQEQMQVHKKRKSAVKDAMAKVKAKEDQIKQREAETAELMKDIQKEHERLMKDTEERSHFFKAMEESLAAKELELTEERQELEELTKDLAGIKRDLEAQQDELVHQLNSRQNNIEHQEHMLDIRSKELESQAKSLEDELAVVQEIKQEVEKTQKDLDDSRRTWMNKVAVKESELSGLKAELEAAKKRLDEEERRVTDSKSALIAESKKVDRAESAEIADLRAQTAKLRLMLSEKEENCELLQSREAKLRTENSQLEAEFARKEAVLKQKEEEVNAANSDLLVREKKLIAQMAELEKRELKLADAAAQYAIFAQTKSEFERYRTEMAQEIESELAIVRREKEELESTALVLEKVHEDLNRARLKNERDAQVIAADFQRIQELISHQTSQQPEGWKRLELGKYQEDLEERKLSEVDRFEEKIRVEEGDSMGSLSLLSLSTPRGSRESSL